MFGECHAPLAHCRPRLTHHALISGYFSYIVELVVVLIIAEILHAQSVIFNTVLTFILIQLLRFTISNNNKYQKAVFNHRVYIGTLEVNINHSSCIGQT